MPELENSLPEQSESTTPPPAGTSFFGKLKTKWPKIILAVVLGLGLLVGAVYAGYWYRTQQAKPTSEFPTISQPITTPVVEDETKDWKTYTDRSGRVSAKSKEGWQEPVLEILEKSPTDSLQDWLRKGDDLERQDPLCQNCFKVFSEREVQIDGKPAIIREVNSHPGGRALRGYTLFDANEVIYIHTCCGDPDIPLSKERHEQFDQVLSTLKFLIPEPTPPGGNQTKDWKTYRSEEYGFEFKYPQNFQVTEGLGQYFLNQKPVIELKSGTFNYLHNQIDAYFTVSVKSNAKAECEYVPRGVMDTLQSKEINGVSFTMFSTSGAATGNTYSSTILHYLKGITCYEIVTTIHEASDGNTPEALPEINEQKTKLENQLDQVLSTFKFLD